MLKALIVDDDQTVRAYLQRILIKKFGFTILQAENGEEALKVLEKDTPDIILLDNSMPVMSGIEFLHKLRDIEKFKKVPVLVISANNERNTIKEMIDLGIIDYILKPIEAEATFKRIQNVIDMIEGK